jgi:zinc protease
MLNLPNDYLQTYREHVQAVTIDDIQRVAATYVKPDQAAIVVVGDGAQVTEQIRPYCEDIEAYTTSGKRKTKADRAAPADIAGSWSINIETPLGQHIPATLIVTRGDNGLRARISSEMGDADLGEIVLLDNSFTANTTLETDGHSVGVQIYARFEGEQTEGSVTLQDSPSLPFEGTRD